MPATKVGDSGILLAYDPSGRTEYGPSYGSFIWKSVARSSGGDKCLHTVTDVFLFHQIRRN
jgi:hypothetical protein